MRGREGEWRGEGRGREGEEGSTEYICMNPFTFPTYVSTCACM